MSVPTSSRPAGTFFDALGIQGPQRNLALTVMAASAALAAFTIYNPLYGAAAAACLVVAVTLLLSPHLAFCAMLLMLTGWPYYVGIPVGRDLPFPFVVPLIGAIWVMVLVRQALGLAPDRRANAPGRVLHIAVLLFGLALVISILLSKSPAEGFKSFSRVGFLPLLIYMIGRHFIRDAQDARRAFDILLIGGAIAGTFAMYEWTIGRNPLLEHFAPPVGDLADFGYWTAQAVEDIGLYRSYGFAMNPIFFGATSAVLLAHACTRFATAGTPATKALMVLLGALVFGGLISTFSRGPLLVAAGALLLVAIAYPVLRKYVLAGLAVMALYAAYSYFGDTSALAERLRDTDNVTLRFKLWQTAWAMFTDHPLFGVGLGQFQDYQLDVIRRHAIGPFFEMGDGRLETVRTAEHGVLQLMAETGIIGALAGAFLVGAVLLRVVPAIFGKGPEPARSSLVAAGVGFLVVIGVGFTVTIYNSWEVGSMVPILLAILVGVPPLAADTKMPQAPPRQAGRDP